MFFTILIFIFCDNQLLFKNTVPEKYIIGFFFAAVILLSIIVSNNNAHNLYKYNFMEIKLTKDHN